MSKADIKIRIAEILRWAIQMKSGICICPWAGQVTHSLNAIVSQLGHIITRSNPTEELTVLMPLIKPLLLTIALSGNDDNKDVFTLTLIQHYMAVFEIKAFLSAAAYSKYFPPI